MNTVLDQPAALPLFPRLWGRSVLGCCFGLLVPFCAAESVADPEKTTSRIDKSGYHLFNPTPKELMREMSTDRPDQTESAYTVDAGHYQIEMDFVNYTYDRTDADRTTDVRTETWNVAPLNVKVGLLNNVDLQVFFANYIHQRTDDRTEGTIDETSGLGDVTTRVKVNLWGNDGGTTAFAVMPFIKAPTNSAQLGNEAVEGGVIFPLAVALPGGWGMGVMTECDMVRDSVTRGYEMEFVNSITFSHDIIGKLGGYVEFFSSVSTQGDTGWTGMVDVGFTYPLTDNIQLDYGCNFGVTRAAEDFNPFVGISMRF
jgi:hypothetical protein